MEEKKIGYALIASSIVWAAVLLGSAMVLKDVPQKERVIQIIFAGTITHLLFIWVPLFKKRKKE